MPQLHFYVPDEVAKAAKARAKAAGKSLSSYLADLVVNEVDGEWPEGFFEEVAGGWRGEPLERQKQGRRKLASRSDSPASYLTAESQPAGHVSFRGGGEIVGVE